jgi:hypothetical protein
VFAYHPIQVLAHFRPRHESFLLRVSRRKLQAARTHPAFRQGRHNVFDRPLGAGSIPRLSAQRAFDDAAKRFVPAGGIDLRLERPAINPNTARQNGF